MACPYFYPLAPLPDGIRVARSPLGRLYRGECHASASSVCPTGEVAELCNFGYARGRCERFPDQAPADCVRLSIQPSGRVIYVLEHRYTPIEHGDVSQGSAQVQRQAAALRESLS